MKKLDRNTFRLSALLITILVGMLMAFASITLPGSPKVDDVCEPRWVGFVSVSIIFLWGTACLFGIKIKSYIALQISLITGFLLLNHLLISAYPELVMYIVVILCASSVLTSIVITHIASDISYIEREIAEANKKVDEARKRTEQANGRAERAEKRAKQAEEKLAKKKEKIEKKTEKST